MNPLGLFITFLVLHQAGVLHCNWWWLTSPLWLWIPLNIVVNELKD